MKKYLLILLLCASSAFAAPPVLDIPPEIKASGDYVIFTPKGDAVAVSYVSQSGVDPLPSELLRDPRTFALATRGLPIGRYKFVAIGSRDDEHARSSFVVVIGDAPPVVVIPPGPGPVIPPDVIPPVVEGPRKVLIIRESTKDTPEFGRMVIALRNGESEGYLKSRGHKLFLLDDNDKDMSGQPTPLVEKWRPHYAGLALPVVFILDDKNQLVHKQAIPPAADSPATVLDILKAHGG